MVHVCLCIPILIIFGLYMYLIYSVISLEFSHAYLFDLMITHAPISMYFKYIMVCSTGNKKIQRKNVNIFLPISFNICFGCSKDLSH